MARITSQYTEHCRCGKCPTRADVTKWDCGCIQVKIINDRAPCSTCTNFSRMRRHCGRSGSPSAGHR